MASQVLHIALTDEVNLTFTSEYHVENLFFNVLNRQDIDTKTDLKFKYQGGDTLLNYKRAQIKLSNKKLKFNRTTKSFSIDSPFFVEQNNYSIKLNIHDQSLDKNKFQFFISNRSLSLKVFENSITSDLNFENEVGDFVFQIQYDSKPFYEIKGEVFSRKMDYREDFQKMNNDIEDYARGLVFASYGDTYIKTHLKPGKSSPWEWWSILNFFMKELKKTINLIEKNPHKIIQKNYNVKEVHKGIKKIDKQSIFWSLKNNQFQQNIPYKTLEINHKINYDTYPNQFLLYTIQEIIKNLRKLSSVQFTKKSDKYDKTIENKKIYKSLEQEHKKIISNQIKYFHRIKELPFLKNISPLKNRNIFSNTLTMDPHYKKFKKIADNLQKCLDINNKEISITTKEISDLYEKWVYFKLVDSLSKNYKAIEIQPIQIETKNNMTFDLKKIGLEFLLSSNKKIRLAYEREFHFKSIKANYHSINLVLKPDYLIEYIENDEVQKSFVFDAKYSLDKTKDSEPIFITKDDNIYKMSVYKSQLYVNQKNVECAFAIMPGDDRKDSNIQKNTKFKNGLKYKVGFLPLNPATNHELFYEKLDEILEFSIKN